MQHNHLENVLLKDDAIKEQVEDLKDRFGVDVHYFWDEARIPKLGAGDYIILGLTFGVGIAAKTLIERGTEILSEIALKAIRDFFKRVADRFVTNITLFFMKTEVKGRTLTVLMDKARLSDNNFLLESQQILEKLILLIEREDEFATEYYDGPLIIKYDRRCEDIMIYPSEFDIEYKSATVLTTSYGWAIVDKPNAAGYEAFRLDNLFLIRAIFHRSLQEYVTAFSFFKRAIKENINNVDAHIELGNTFYHGGRYREAVDAWDRALDVTAESDVRLAEIYFNLACGMVKLKNMKGAARRFEKALESGLDGELIKSDPDLGNFRRSEHYGELLKHLD
ncbi:MAG: tetratricopeptide repeat protein [Planctomycetota bacterium]|jgi:tetratricopeptide (TPR) repeat protein